MSAATGVVRSSAAPSGPWFRRLLVVFGFVFGAWLLGSLLDSASAAPASSPGSHHVGPQLGLRRPVTIALAHTSVTVAPSNTSVTIARPHNSATIAPPLTVAPGSRPARTLAQQLPATAVVEHAARQIVLAAQGISSSATGSLQQLLSKTVDTTVGVVRNPSQATGTIRQVVTATPAPTTQNRQVSQGKTAPSAPSSETAPLRMGGVAAGPAFVSSTGMAAGATSSAGTALHVGAASLPAPEPVPTAPVAPDPQSVGGGAEAQIHDAGSAVLPSRLTGTPLPQPARLAVFERDGRRDRATQPAVSPD